MRKELLQKNVSARKAGQTKPQSATLFFIVLAGNLVIGKPVFGTPKVLHEPELGWAIANRATC